MVLSTYLTRAVLSPQAALQGKDWNNLNPCHQVHNAKLLTTVFSPG
ncbi:MAG: hypothetical protein GDA36_12730 [Rhodobacteraceae bacterium]|nr:hypothetical protein [Paracoccaceae bacterium]